MNNRDNSIADNPDTCPGSRHRFVAVVGDGEAHTRSATTDVLEPDRDVLLARCEIAEAYYHGGDKLALAALAASSLRLYGSVVAGDLSANDLFDDLQECASNLGIAERLQDEVQMAISFGPRRYGAAA